MYQLSAIMKILSGIDHTHKALESLEADLRNYTAFMKSIPSSDVVSVDDEVLLFVLQGHCDAPLDLLQGYLQEAYLAKEFAVA